MGNYIRACFCSTHFIPAASFYDLLKTLSFFDCKYNVWKIGVISGYLSLTKQELSVEGVELDNDSNQIKLQELSKWMSTPGYLTVKLDWMLNGKFYEARIVQSWHNETESRFLSFDIDETVFLPGSDLEFVPNDTIFFEKFKQILIEFVRYLRPFFGSIDYEADIQCEALEKHSPIISWGNYFSQSMLKGWFQNNVNSLSQIPNESLQIDELGILTFIHPLTVNQAWTDRHKKMQSLIVKD